MPFLIVVLVLALVFAAGSVVYTTGLFGVAQVRVAGTVLASPEDIRAAAGVRYGTPLAQVDLATIAARVERLPVVREATVERDWPSALVVRVVERTPVAVVPRNGWWTSIDATGVAFFDEANRPALLPLVRLAAPGPDDATTRAALTVLLALNDELRGRLVELVAEAPARIRLSLTGDRTVVWGDATENEAKVRVAVVLLTRPDRVLDVSAPSVVTVR